MLNTSRAVARFIQNTIGWNRIGVLLSVTIIAVAVVVLIRLLRGIEVDDVFVALKATQMRHIAAHTDSWSAGRKFTPNDGTMLTPRNRTFAGIRKPTPRGAAASGHSHCP